MGTMRGTAHALAVDRSPPFPAPSSIRVAWWSGRKTTINSGTRDHFLTLTALPHTAKADTDTDTSPPFDTPSRLFSHAHHPRELRIHPEHTASIIPPPTHD